jgi:hypothetical protein
VILPVVGIAAAVSGVIAPPGATMELPKFLLGARPAVAGVMGGGAATTATFSWNFWRHMGHFPRLASLSSQFAMQWMWKVWVHWPMTDLFWFCLLVNVRRIEKLTDPSMDGRKELLTDGTVAAGVFALRTRPFEIHAADATGVVGVVGEVPFPGGEGVVGFDLDLHCGRLCFVLFCFLSLIVVEEITLSWIDEEAGRNFIVCRRGV